MNYVSGKVLLKETNVGISNLLVEIYDVDPNIRPTEVVNADAATLMIATNPERSIRLVSGATQEDGLFDGRGKLDRPRAKEIHFGGSVSGTPSFSRRIVASSFDGLSVPASMRRRVTSA